MNNSILVLLPRLLLAIAAVLTPAVGYAAVSLPNGTVNEYVEDMRVKALGGDVVIDRQYYDGRWTINLSWKPAVYTGVPLITGSCTAYSTIKVRDRDYTGTGEGTAWSLDNRYTVRAKDYFSGTDCQANRIQTLRWQDRQTGQWMEYQRADSSQLQYQLVRYGDRNNNTVTLDYDTASQPDLANLSAGKIKYVRDNNNNILYTYTYTGEQLIEIKDNHSLVADNISPARSVKYSYTNTTYKGQTYPVITQVTDVLGNKINYTITNGELNAIIDQENRTQRYQYTAGRVTKYTDALSHITTYKYDYNKDKQQFYVRIDNPPTEAGQLITENWYDKSGNLIRRDLNGKVDYQKTDSDTATRSYIETDASGRQITITKDEFGNIIKTQYPDGTITSATYSSTHGGMLSQNDELGIKTQYDYDTRGNLIKTTEALGLPEQRITEYTVNGNGQIISVTRKGGPVTQSGQVVTTLDAIWQLQYNSLDHLTEVTDPEGNKTRYAYNLQGKLIQTTNALDNKTLYQVNAAGQLTKITNALNYNVSYAYDKVGNRTHNIDEKGKTILSAYDASNRRVQRTNQVGGIHRVQLNVQGMPIGETDEDGKSTQAKFDNLMRISEVIDGLGNKTQYEYPEVGSDVNSQVRSQPSIIKYPTYTEQYQYNDLGQVAQQTTLNPNTANTSTATSTEGLVTTNKYDKRGLVIENTNAEGKTNYTSYDSLGRISKFTNSLGHSLQIAWDTHDNIIQIQDYKGKTSRFEYDKNSRVTKQILPLGQETRYTYDAVDNVRSITDSLGNVIQYDYDALSRTVKTKITNSEQSQSNGSPGLTYTYNYDATGNLTQWSDGTRSGVYNYDDAGRLLTETTNYGDNISLSYAYSYTPAGYKKTLTLPDTTVINYGYSAHGEVDQITIPDEGTMSVNAWQWVAPKQVTLPGGTTSESSYDGLLKLTGLKVKSAGQQTLLELINQYGKLQEIKASTITDSTTTNSASVNMQYIYDSEQQLTQATRDTGGLFGTSTENFSLDAAGNRISHSAVSGTWTYDDNNRLTQRGAGNTATSYQYDDNGNLIRRTIGTTGVSSTITNLKYDALSRLIEVQDGSNATIVQYQYDFLDNRLSKTIYRDAQGNPLSTAQTTYYLYADEGLIAEADNTGNITTQYGWKPDGIWGTDPLFIKTNISTTVNGNTNTQTGYAYYHNSQLGVPLRATDKTGQVIWRMDSNSFGAATIPSDNKLTSNLRLSGQYYDAETGLHYNTRRYYDPSTGRYITQDPQGYAGGWNLYKYANNDPINQIDPTGEWVWVVIQVAVTVYDYYEEYKLVREQGECYDWTRLIPYPKWIPKTKWIPKRFKQCSNPCECMGGGGGKHSFPGDTLVHTQDIQGKAALKAIANIQVGDKVLAKSEWKAEAESLSYETVTDVFTTPTQVRTLVHITLANGKTLTATDGHSFKTPDGWRDAILLKKGGKLLLKGDKQEHTANIVEIRHSTETLTTYSLEVANAHTFFVGEEGVLVHNARVKPPAPGRPTPGNTGGKFGPGPGSGHYKYHPPFGCKGWKDKDGNVWEPNDHNGTHAPHWDVQHPGGGHTPTYPE